VGKVSFQAAKLAENAGALISSVIKAKPASAKGKYVRSIVVSSTMGPGLPIDLASV
jgi:large subunit ribosomal protein L1